MNAAIDHLVVGAATLDEAAAWCEATLGVMPGPGGEHPLMGTHNRVLRADTAEHPRAYFEWIAAQPGTRPQQGRRWFDLDDARVQEALGREGPRLLHFVARVSDVRAARQALRELGVDPGEVVSASRSTASGLLQWQITVRSDGQRQFGGAFPALIEWGGPHPSDALPAGDIALHALTVRHPQAAQLRRAYEAIGLRQVRIEAGDVNVCAVLDTPRGRIRLESGGI